jgi:hypothetical protein
MNKQTAVEWLVSELLDGKTLMPSLIEQAKAMEKEQIIDTYLEASANLEDITKEAAEQYYNEKYGGTNEQEKAVTGYYFSEFEQHYKNSNTDAIAFISNLKHKDLYEVFDLVSKQWIKQKYTYLEDNNEQETPQKMLHGFRMGWIRSCNIQQLTDTQTYGGTND